MQRAPRAPQAALLVGTRPEIVKMSPILREARRRGIDLLLIHGGQHYDDDMDGCFFRDLGLRAPDLRVEGRGLDAEAFADLLAPELRRLACSSLLVHGDTTTALAGALAMRNCDGIVVHVEAGLRCDDRAMLEEQNRRRIDVLSDWLFVPTRHQLGNLRREGLLDPSRQAKVVGNTIVDALDWMLPRLDRLRRERTPEPDSARRSRIVLTLHRAEVADRAKIEHVVHCVAVLAFEFGVRVDWPVHPRMRALLPDRLPACLRVTSPRGWPDFLGLLRNAKLILTDSGGLQEEAMVLRIPCVTLRPSTERPETLTVGANCLVPPEAPAARWVASAREMLGRRVPMHPWGDGRTAIRILDALEAAGVTGTRVRPFLRDEEFSA